MCNLIMNEEKRIWFLHVHKDGSITAHNDTCFQSSEGTVIPVVPKSDFHGWLSPDEAKALRENLRIQQSICADQAETIDGLTEQLKQSSDEAKALQKELKDENEYSESLAKDICKMEDVLGFAQDQHDKDGAFIPTIGPWLERVRDLLAAEGELGDLKDETKRLEAQCAAMREAFGIGNPWPLIDVLSSLKQAARHLLYDHTCDHIGHEAISENIKRAQDYMDRCGKALSTTAGRELI